MMVKTRKYLRTLIRYNIFYEYLQELMVHGIEIKDLIDDIMETFNLRSKESLFFIKDLKEDIFEYLAEKYNVNRL